ncbi:MAG: zf-HC2 domain-containing protein [Lachnospiraceae bacterium]
MKLTCYVTEDLLPSYIEGLTNEQTSEDLKEHLKECESCREIYEAMKADWESKKTDKREPPLEYLKKVKNRQLLQGMTGIAAVVVLLIFLVYLTWRSYGIRTDILYLLQPGVAVFCCLMLKVGMKREKIRHADYFALHGITGISVALAGILFVTALSAAESGGASFLFVEVIRTGRILRGLLLGLLAIETVVMADGIRRSIKISYCYYSVVSHALTGICVIAAFLIMLGTLSDFSTLWLEFRNCAFLYIEGIAVASVLQWLLARRKRKE